MGTSSFKDFLYLVLALSLSAGTMADTISGKITFVKRPPLGGVLYVKSANGSVNNIDASIDQIDKKFTAKVVVGTPNSTAIFNNSDANDHNIFVNDLDSNVSFDVGLIPSGSKATLPIDWKSETLVRMGCKIHPKMKAYIGNIPSNHFATLEFEKKVKEYDIKIDNVPTENSKVVLRLPKYDPVEVDLNKGGSITVELIRKGKIRGSISLQRS